MPETSQPYAPPVDRLLTLGEGPARQREWPDYLEFGFGKEHVPELIRMALDEALFLAERAGPEVWAPVHAWRALGQLRAEEAVPSLLALIADADFDWALDELPMVFGMIGPASLPDLSPYAADPDRGVWSRISAAEGLNEVAKAHPAARDQVVATLVGVLEEWDSNDESLNAYLIHFLVGLGATEAAPLMEQAFSADRVDTMLRGDWEDAQVDLGLLAERRTPRPRFHGLPTREPEAPNPPRKPGGGRKANTKRKMAAQSRKRNRRK